MCATRSYLTERCALLGGWVGVDNVRDEKKAEARKLLINRQTPHPSSARFVSPRSFITYVLSSISIWLFHGVHGSGLMRGAMTPLIAPSLIKALKKSGCSVKSQVQNIQPSKPYLQDSTCQSIKA